MSKFIVPIVSLTPVSTYADGSPIYAFHTSFPSRGVRTIKPVFPTADEAYEAAKVQLKKWEAGDRYSRMGEVIGVVEAEGGYQAVINTYSSST